MKNAWYGRAFAVAMVLIVASCAPKKNAFVGTWKLVSSSRPVSTDHIVIDSVSIEYVNNDGSRPTFTYSLVDDHEAIMQEAGMAAKLVLTGPNTLHSTEVDSVFQRE